MEGAGQSIKAVFKDVASLRVPQRVKILPCFIAAYGYFLVGMVFVP